MGLALLRLLLQESAPNTRARSPSRIERSRTRLPVGLRSLMCENFLSQVREILIIYTTIRNNLSTVNGTENLYHVDVYQVKSSMTMEIIIIKLQNTQA